MKCCDQVVKPSQVRKIKPTRLVPSGVFSFRNFDSIPNESPLERDFLYLMAFDPDVTEIIPQPVRLSYTAQSGRQYPYTPDFLVYYRSRNPLLVEVKPKELIRTDWQTMKPRFKAALHYAKAQSWAFRIFDERKIRTPKLSCIKSLQAFRQMRLSSSEIGEALSVVRKSGRSKLGRLLEQRSTLPRELLRAALLHQLAHMELKCDMNGPISDETEIWGSYE